MDETGIHDFTSETKKTLIDYLVEGMNYYQILYLQFCFHPQLSICRSIRTKTDIFCAKYDVKFQEMFMITDRNDTDYYLFEQSVFATRKNLQFVCRITAFEPLNGYLLFECTVYYTLILYGIAKIGCCLPPHRRRLHRRRSLDVTLVETFTTKYK